MPASTYNVADVSRTDLVQNGICCLCVCQKDHLDLRVV